MRAGQQFDIGPVGAGPSAGPPPVGGLSGPDSSIRTAVTTTSTGVENTYYGQPVIKAPHWRWLVIVYFFLGAIAGGSAVIASLAEMFSPDRRLVRVARYISFAALLPSPPLLILDLGRPERFLNMLRIIKLRSPMSLGSWALAGLGAFSGLLAMLQFVRDVLGRDIPRGMERAAGILVLPFAGFVSGYTGVLLAATNVPLWARNYLLIGPTFVASAFSSSLATISLVLSFGAGERAGTGKKLARAEAVCIATELGLLGAGMLRLGRLGHPLTRGTWGKIFWPVTVLSGLLVPLGLQLSTGGHAGSPVRRRLAAVLVLTGGFSLRTLIIFAGRESARRPEDYFEYTRSQRRGQSL